MAKNPNLYFSWNLETGCERAVPTDLGPHGAVLERNAVVLRTGNSTGNSTGNDQGIGWLVKENPLLDLPS